SNQIPLKEKEERADFVIFNNGTREDLEQKTEGLMRKIKECLDIGAAGYITKESAVDEIVQKLNLVLDSFRLN
ncbi:MAG: hypothetical protein ACU85E_16475, partial [Gammaproteobacteria bacterium]